MKIGFRSAFDSTDRNRARRRRRTQEQASEEKGEFEIDVQSLFSIRCVFILLGMISLYDVRSSDTTQLALLIDERDEVLENLEIAETKYIQSFRLSTPDPSIADWEPPAPPHEEPERPAISRPKPLSSATVSETQTLYVQFLSAYRSVEDGEAGIPHLALPLFRRPRM